MTTETVRDPGTGVETLRVTGPMTLNTLFDFQQALRESTGPATVIDLSGVPYMDSAGLGAVLSFHVSCGRSSRKYALAGVAPRLLTMMQVAHVDTLLHMFPDAAAAQQYLMR